MTCTTHYISGNWGSVYAEWSGHSAYLRNNGGSTLYLVQGSWGSERDAFPIYPRCELAFSTSSVDGFWILGDEVDEPIPKTKWIYDDE